MATFNKFNDFIEALCLGQHDLNGDTFKMYLSNTAPNASTHADKGDLAEISTGNGYSGPVDIQNAMTETGGTATMTAVDVTVTASGGSVGPFEYVVLFNDDHTTDGLFGWYQHTEAVTLADGESFTTDFGASLSTFA